MAVIALDPLPCRIYIFTKIAAENIGDILNHLHQYIKEILTISSFRVGTVSKNDSFR